MNMKSFINKILNIKPIKVLLCIIENIIKSINLNLWKLIERKFFNPYDFWKTNIDHTKKLYDDILEISKKFNYELNNKNVLELWPGWFLWVWAFLKKEWISKYYVIDEINHFEKLDKKNIELYNEIDKSILIWNNFDWNYIKQLEYSSNWLPLKDNFIDIVFSNAVYEHVNEPWESIKELSKITKQWWIWIHIIDFRDHIFNQKSLYFLTIPNFLFNFLFKKSWAWVNRKRYTDFVKYFKDNWFEILDCKFNNDFIQWEEKKYKKLLEKISKKDLLISDAQFIVKKI